MKIYDAVATGKSLSEAPIFASTNLQYDNRLFIELQVQYMKIPGSNLGRFIESQVQYMKIPGSEYLQNMLCTQIVVFVLF